MTLSLRRWALQYRIPQLLLFGAPIAARRFGSQSIVWPPLGSLDTYAVYVATLMIGVCWLLSALLETKRQARRALVWAAGLAAVMFLVYSFLVERYVIAVETPANGQQVRSVGYKVTPRIRELYPDKNDPELLRIGGLDDWEIQKVWTPGSVLLVRLGLLTSLALTLGTANFAFGSAARAARRRSDGD